MMGITAAQMGTVALGMQAGGAISGAIGARSQARSLKANAQMALAAGEGNEAIANANARMLEAAGQQELYKGTREGYQAGAKYRSLKATQRATMAANGIDVNADGTAADVQASTDAAAEIDQAQIERNAIMSAWGYKTQATATRLAGKQQKLQAVAAAAGGQGVSPGMAAFSSLLSGAGTVASSWYRMDRGVGLRREA